MVPSKFPNPASVKPGPRLCDDLLASCTCDWVERFPTHVVAGWPAHAPLIAARRSWQVRDAHFDLAVGKVEAAANPATQARQGETTDDQGDTTPDRVEVKNPENAAESVGVGAACDPVENEQVTPMGFEPMSPP